MLLTCSVIPQNTCDWPSLRKDFPVLAQEVHGKPPIYFDNAATRQRRGASSPIRFRIPQKRRLGL
jgi:hypothetical protein